jgi:hypothetical protein
LGPDRQGRQYVPLMSLSSLDVYGWYQKVKKLKKKKKKEKKGVKLEICCSPEKEKKRKFIKMYLKQTPNFFCIQHFYFVS